MLVPRRDDIFLRWALRKRNAGDSPHHARFGRFLAIETIRSQQPLALQSIDAKKLAG